MILKIELITLDTLSNSVVSLDDDFALVTDHDEAAAVTDSTVNIDDDDLSNGDEDSMFMTVGHKRGTNVENEMFVVDTTDQGPVIEKD